MWRHLPPPEVKGTSRQKLFATTHISISSLPREKSVSNTYHLFSLSLSLSIYIYIYKCSKQKEQLVTPRSVNYRLRRTEIVRENTGPQHSATNKKKIHTHLKTTEKETTAQDQPRAHQQHVNLSSHRPNNILSKT